MVGLITEILRKLLLAICTVAFSAYLVPALLTFGESQFQSLVVFSFYIYCIISLFTYSRHKLFYVLSLPVLTQFIHIFQKYSFTTGANSGWRLLPFIILDVYFIDFFVWNKTFFSQKNRLFIFSWIIINSFFLLISPNLERIIGGGIILYLLSLPLFFIYFNQTTLAHDFRVEIEKYLCLIFIILGLGTFGLVLVSAGYKGSDNLLVTRNIADTNVTMAYFILLWPFVLLYSLRNKVSHLFKMGMLTIFLGTVALSFSRGAVLIVIPYVLVSALCTKGFISFKWIVPVIFLVLINRSTLGGLIENHDLAYFWKLRFGDLNSFSSLLTKLESISGRAEIHQLAYSLFLKSPIIGHGTQSFEILGPGYREAHSLWFTLLAEQGIIGVVYYYGIFLALLLFLAKSTLKDSRKNVLLLISFLFYLLFNHTVGSVFVILPGNSITINCIAPVILLCLYFYPERGEKLVSGPEMSNRFHP